MAHQIWIILFKSVIMPLTDLIPQKTTNKKVKNNPQYQTIETFLSGKLDYAIEMNKYSFHACQALTCSSLKSVLLWSLQPQISCHASQVKLHNLLDRLTDCFSPA